ncbi:MAG TPA: alpha/beta hydrolase [Chthoniobacterales bacterium]
MSKLRLHKRLWGFSIGAGLLGALALGVRYAIKPPTKSRVPDTISPAIFATKSFSTSRGEMVFHESGLGNPLIFLHGIYVGACSYEWSRVYPAFAANHHVMAPDLIGFGESERPSKPFTSEDFVRSIADFIHAKCPDRPPIIVASGLSAALATLLATQHPELVSRLILVMPSGMQDDSKQEISVGLGLISRLPLLNHLYYRNYLSARPSVRAWLETVGFADAALVDDETVEVFTTCAQQYRAENAIFNFLRRQLNVNLESRFAEVTQPVTLIWSDRVTSPPVELAYRLQESKPNRCHLIILKNLGLLVALEAPQLIKETLASELDSGIRIVSA